jgi:hypothetical protein
MKTAAIFAMLLASAWIAVGAEATNSLAIYLVLVPGEVPYRSIEEGTATSTGLKLEVPVLLSDKDFVAYNTTNYTFVITPDAAQRVGERCHDNQTPFVVVACGEPIYLGVFTSRYSSLSSGVPTIRVDDCIRKGNQTNVSLKVDRGYPSDGFGGGPDRRGDQRIISAARKLFPDANNAR